MLNSLPAPILLDIAIFFTALSWGLGAYLVDKKVLRLRLARDRLLRLPSRIQRPKPRRAHMGGRGRTDSSRLLASVVRSEKPSKDVDRICRNLGDLHRVPCPAKLAAPL